MRLDSQSCINKKLKIKLFIPSASSGWQNSQPSLMHKAVRAGYRFATSISSRERSVMYVEK